MCSKLFNCVSYVLLMFKLVWCCLPFARYLFVLGMLRRMCADEMEVVHEHVCFLLEIIVDNVCFCSVQTSVLFVTFVQAC